MNDQKPEEKPEVEEEVTEEILKLSPPLTCSGSEHFFRIIGMEMGMPKAKCDKCPAGYFLAPECKLVKGHIYMNEDLVV